MYISNLKNARFGKPASQSQIESAELRLNLKFAEDYKKYLSKYGVVSAHGIELTGLTLSKRLNVVEITKREREMINGFPSDAYVIEDLAIEGIVIIQKQDGKIYSVDMTGKMEYICNSLQEYISRSVF